MRVHELAKELNITSKELIEKANDTLGLSLKSHSSTIGDGYVDKIKALYDAPKKPTAKPKAFVVKKQKAQEPVEEVTQEQPVQPVVKTVSKLEIVRSAPKSEPTRPHSPKPHQKPEKPQENSAKIFVEKKNPIENSTDKLSSLPSMTRKNFSKPVEEKYEKVIKNLKSKSLKRILHLLLQ